MSALTKTLRSRVITRADAQEDPRMQEDSYLAKVIRYIPAEIVATYVAASSAVESATNVPNETVLWIITIVLAILTPLWIIYAANLPEKPKPWFQAAAALVGFLVWVFALGGPFVYFPWYQPLYGSLLLTLTTLVIPLVERVTIKSTVPAAARAA